MRIIGFHPSFSRHGRAKVFALFIWLIVNGALLSMLLVTASLQSKTLTFSDREPMGNMRTQVTRQVFAL